MLDYRESFQRFNALMSELESVADCINRADAVAALDDKTLSGTISNISTFNEKIKLMGERCENESAARGLEDVALDAEQLRQELLAQDWLDDGDRIL